MWILLTTERETEMIPVSDEGAEQSREFPIVNIAIIVLNFVMFGVELIWGDVVVNGWSLIPKEIVTGQDSWAWSMWGAKRYSSTRRHSATYT
jgi:hypothetical protein